MAHKQPLNQHYKKTLQNTLKSVSIAGLLGTSALFGLSGAINALDNDKADKETWTVNTPPLSVEGTTVDIDVTSGTWMSLDVSPDGKWIVFDLLGDIYRMPITGGKAENISSGVAWDMQPRFSPDGSKIAFTSDRAGGDNIWVMNVDGSDAKQITKESFRLLNNPTWSPDGNYIAARKHFTTARSLGTGEIWLYHIDGGNGVQVVKRPNEQYQKELGEPMFTPDGNAIYYTQNATPGNTFIYAQDSNKQIFHIRKVDLKTGEIDNVVGGPGGAVRPTPSPDGRYIAYIKRVRAQSKLFLMDLKSGEERMIHQGVDQDMQETWGVQGMYPNMDWTPDSKSIVFWAKGKLNRIDITSNTVADIPFAVKDSRTIYAPPKFDVDVAPDTFKTKMIRFASPSPDGKSVVFEALGKLYVKGEDGKARRLTSRDKDDVFELFPVWSKDGRSIYYTTWDDEALGTVRRVNVRGGKSTILSREKGHYVDLSISADGDTLLYRKRTGGRLLNPDWGQKPGIYTMPAKGGTSTFVTESGNQPHFGADGRIYAITRAPNKTTLFSVNANGNDKRDIATSAQATDMLVSPKGDWVTWRENYQVFVSPLPTTGKAIKLNPKGGNLPVKRLSQDGGIYLGWSEDGKSVHWSLGPTMKSVAVADAYKDDFKKPETGVDISITANADKPNGLTAITGARIATMNDSDQVIENGVILIRDNRIEAIGSADNVNIPSDAKTVDAAGKTIIPGIIDIHAHGPYGTGNIIPKQNWSTLAHLALGVTTVHDPSSRANLVFAASEYARAGVTLGPRIYSTAEIVYGAKTTIWAPIDSIDDALSHIRRLKAQGAISVKNYNQPRRDQRQQVVDAARREGMMVVAEGGSLYHMDMNMVVDGNTSIEHTLPNQHIYEDVIEFWPQTDVGFTPTLVVAYGGVRGEDYWYDNTEVWKHPILSKFVPPRVLQPRSVRRQRAPEADYGDDENAALAKQLMDEGVSVHIGAHGQREGLGSHWEMWSFARGGMSPMEALKTATINPAKQFGMSKDIGSLEVGKLADLVIIDGNPLNDIRESDKVEKVMINGRLFDANTLNEEVTGERKTRPFYWHGKPESEIR